MAEFEIGNLYEINKDLMKNETPLDPILLNRKCQEVGEWLCEREYSMLLCHEQRDYSVFNTCADDALTEAASRDLRDSLTNRGTVVAIDKQPDGNYEIWIRNVETQENYCYYLFDYTFGIINVGE